MCAYLSCAQSVCGERAFTNAGLPENVGGVPTTRLTPLEMKMQLMHFGGRSRGSGDRRLLWHHNQHISAQLAELAQESSSQTPQVKRLPEQQLSQPGPSRERTCSVLDLWHHAYQQGTIPS